MWASDARAVIEATEARAVKLETELKLLDSELANTINGFEARLAKLEEMAKTPFIVGHPGAPR